MEENKIIWQGQSYGLINRIIGLTATSYEIIGDELIIKEGFLNRNTNIIKLSDLQSISLIENLYQRLIKVGTIYIKKYDGKVIMLKNLKDPENVRRILNDLLMPKQLENNIGETKKEN